MMDIFVEIGLCPENKRPMLHKNTERSIFIYILEILATVLNLNQFDIANRNPFPIVNESGLITDD